MSSFDFNAIHTALDDSEKITSGVDFSGKSLKLDSAADAQPIVDAINACPNLQYLTLTGNTLGVAAAEAIAGALALRPELKVARFSDMFTGRMKTEIPPALRALGEGMIKAGARLSVLDLSDNAFGPVGVEGLAALLRSDVCSELEELRLNNNGLGVSGARLLAAALAARPRRLRVLVAGRNRLENGGAQALAPVLQSMGTLEEVAMPQNGIYHAGIGALSQAFGANERLATINLNDNTIGAKGASHIAHALPRLKNLKSVNFGDCLLKSKGAMTLADAFRDNDTRLECLDLSHNEMGRGACMAVVDSLAGTRDAAQRLARVSLAGNSLGGAANRQAMRERLGGAAHLSDAEGSDDEYVTDSEESGAESEDGGSEAEAHSDADTTQRTVADVTVDTSIEEVDTDVGRFLRDPCEETLRALGPNAADVIDAHLQCIKEPSEWIPAYVEALMLAAGVGAGVGAGAAHALCRALVSRCAAHHAVQWLLCDAMLRALQLIKSENKDYKIRWSLPECYTALAGVIDAPFFPPSLRDTLKFFISSKLASMPREVREAVEQHPSLHSTGCDPSYL